MSTSATSSSSPTVSLPLTTILSTPSPPPAPTSPPAPTDNGPGAANIFGSNNLYQSVIIALVAGGVFSLAFMSVVVRRRRYREMQANIRDRQQRLDEAYAFLRRPSGGGGEREVGRRPSFWDVIVGARPEYADGAGSESSKSITEKGKEVEDEEEGEVDVEGQMRNGWIPTSLALSHHALLSSADTARIAAEVTVLISMPSPDSPTSSPRRQSAPLYEAPPEEENLPAVQLASTTVNVASLNLAKRREVDRWMRDAERRRTQSGTRSSSTVVGGARIERTDGFRGDSPW